MNDSAVSSPRLTVRELVDLLDASLTGPADLEIDSMEAIDRAGPEQLTFINSEKYARAWPDSRARAVIAAHDLEIEPGDGRALLAVRDVDLAVAKVLQRLAPPPVATEPGVHTSAVVDPSASIDPSARVGPLCYVGRHVHIGPHTVLHASVTLLDDTTVGAHCVLWPGVVVRERCTLGDHVILHPNTTIGADGFGYRHAPDRQSIVKIPQIGAVRIGDHVEIGANSCVDRAKFGVTEIGPMTKIDNLVQIGHNCRVGQRVIIAGSAGLAGSVTVGDDAVIGGAAILRDHVTIGPNARIAGFSGVMTDVPADATWGGYPAQDVKIALREQAAVRKLPEFMRQQRRSGPRT